MNSLRCAIIYLEILTIHVYYMDCTIQLRSSHTDYVLGTNPKNCHFVAVHVIRGLCGIGLIANFGGPSLGLNDEAGLKL